MDPRLGDGSIAAVLGEQARDVLKTVSMCRPVAPECAWYRAAHWVLCRQAHLPTPLTFRINPQVHGSSHLTVQDLRLSLCSQIPQGQTSSYTALRCSVAASDPSPPVTLLWKAPEVTAQLPFSCCPLNAECILARNESCSSWL